MINYIDLRTKKVRNSSRMENQKKYAEFRATTTTTTMVTTDKNSTNDRRHRRQQTVTISASCPRVSGAPLLLLYSTAKKCSNRIVLRQLRHCASHSHTVWVAEDQSSIGDFGKRGIWFAFGRSVRNSDGRSDIRERSVVSIVDWARYGGFDTGN